MSLAETNTFPSGYLDEQLADVYPIGEFDDPVDANEYDVLAEVHNLDDYREQVEKAPEVILIRADAVPEIHHRRQEMRQESINLIESRYQMMFEGREDEVPLEVNALSTARNVREMERKHGTGSPEHKSALAVLYADTQRLVQESWRRKKPEYFAKVAHTFSKAKDSFMAGAFAIKQMTLNALTVVRHDEEGYRRINERVEDGTTIDFYKRDSYQGRPIEEWRVLTFSECADWAIKLFKEDQKTDRKRSYSGYVPEIEKLGIRMFSFDKKRGVREEEQILMPGLDVSHDVLIDALKEIDLLDENDDLDKIQLHGNQIIAHESVFDTVLDVAELVDAKASAKHGTPIFMGERVDEDHHMDYSRVPIEAQERIDQQEDDVNDLMDYILDLVDKGISDKNALKRVVGYLDNQMHEQAEADPDLAEAMFDSNTAENYREVNRLMNEGQIEEANEQRMKTRDEAPLPDFCGSDDCGVDELDSVDSAKAKSMGLEPIQTRDGQKDKFLRAKGAACDDCGSKRTAIGKGKKACLDCGTKQDIGHFASFMKKFQKDKEATQESAPEENQEEKDQPQVTRIEKVAPEQEQVVYPKAA